MLPQQQQQVAQNSQAPPNQNGNTNAQQSESDQMPRIDNIKQEPNDGHQNNGIKHGLGENDIDIDIKTEGNKSDMRPPPEKKMKPN